MGGTTALSWCVEMFGLCVYDNDRSSWRLPSLDDLTLQACNTAVVSLDNPEVPKYRASHLLTLDPV